MVSKVLWNIVQKAENQLDVYLYDDIEGDSKNWWTGEVEESETSASHIKQILEDNPNATQINLYINSYGGSVKEGLGIFNQLKRHTAQKVAYIDGFACSIASVIAMACDKVVMGPNSLMMIHHASMGCYGNSEELRKAANDLDVIDKASCSSYLLKAGDKLNEDTLNELLDNQTWLNAEQCMQYGLCDEITGQEDKTIEEAKQRYKAYISQKLNKDIPKPKVPEQFTKQLTNYERLKQKFNKKEGIKNDNEK